MSRPIVAIIDEGIFLDRFDPAAPLIDEIDIYESNDLSRISGDRAEQRWHGTNIASIIRQVFADAPILSVRMMPRASINVPLLCKALRFCSELPGIRIINISLGILGDACPSPDLLESCMACEEKGKVLVAAAHFNCKMKCFPAAFPFVYGVGVGAIEDINEFSFLGDGYINILSKGIHQRLFGEGGRPIIYGGTSYAAAAFSGILCKMLHQRGILSKTELHEAIKKDSVNVTSLHYPGNGTPKSGIKGISLDQIEKEWKWMSYAYDITALVESNVFRDQLILHMVGLADTGAECRQYPGIPTVRPVLSGKIFTRVNTLLLGNFFNDRYLINIYHALSLIDFFIANQGNFIVFDPRIAEVIKNSVISRKTDFSGKIVIASDET